MRGYLLLRPVAISLLFLHIVLRLTFDKPSIFIDLILFNLVGLLAAVIA
jgi:hypothetical protein